MLLFGEIDPAPVRRLLDSFGIALAPVPDAQPIPGSYWGEPEAGLVGATVHARRDTPVHSLLHEACHLIVLAPGQRESVHTDATRSVAEEDASCYLQIVLGARLPEVGAERLMCDMDAWGYTFRLGSTRAWFEHDAELTRAWLAARELPHRLD